MNNDDLLEDSDSSDEDYVPDTKPNEQLSEVDSDGNPEETISDNEDRTTKKRKRKPAKSRKKQKLETEEIVETPEKEEELTVEEKKKKDDELWADFLKDTGFQSKNNKSNDTNKNQQKLTNNTTTTTTTSNISTTKPVDKVKITQIFEFAGEEVKVEKEVARNSAEARLLNKNPETTNPNCNKIRTKNSGLGGISNVLSQIGKKPKISTLEKSKLDWDQFKKEENIDEELRTFNKGKDGYLEKQDFLQRADLRRFEIEREIRSVERSKRLNNTL